MPHTVLHSLQDVGSVQTLDGTAHRHRRGLFLDSLDAHGRARLAAAFLREWDTQWARWRSQESVSLLTGSARVLTTAALEWTGLPTDDVDIDRRAREFLLMIDGAGSFGGRNIAGRTLRRRTERWAQQTLRDLRRNPDAVAPGTPVGRLLSYREDGRELDEVTAAVELLNLLRPTVAISRFIGFAGLALHLHPAWRERLSQDDTVLTAFTEEVRRTAPFFPGIGGRALADTSWDGIRFAQGDWVYVDMFATMRDPGRWSRPETFDPLRFVERASADLIPQGTGSMAVGHRCPGEPATVDLLALAIRTLARSSWSVPRQDLRVDLRRIPASPGARGMLIQVGP
jgi:fatty-acid peroxygenase